MDSVLLDAIAVWGARVFEIRTLHAGAALIALLAPVSAVAGEAVLYGPAPEWVVAADFASAQAKGESIVLFDQQARLEGGTLSNFRDIAYKIDNPEALTKNGTLQVGWLPDKGELTVHRIEIYRGGQTIDLLAAGSRYTVLRREKALEQRSLDGALTATLAIPGLKLGDIVRFSQTTTLRDQALGSAMQMAVPLMAAPIKIGFGRVAASWPSGTDMNWQVSRGLTAPEPVKAGGYTTLTVPLPLAKQEEMPKDAPSRFTLVPMVQVTNFAGWEDVSRRMAPHFATQGLIAANGALAKQVAAIAARSDDPLTRAAAALRVVQDDVAYLMNGLNGGNYLPQSPAETWQNRFGDCKAKSLLLLAMLRAMNIESEAVLVRSRDGDALASLLHMAGNFDHMIVRAMIGGREYWLDGTSNGTRIDTIDEVPPYHYALPLREGGAKLIALAQRWPQTRDRTVRVVYDYRAGIDMPVLYEATMEIRGAIGSAVREQVAEQDRDTRLAFAEKLMKDFTGEGVVYDAKLAYDESAGVGTVTVKGLQSTGFEYERGRGTLAIGLPGTGMEFAPDRARAAWRDIPYAVGGPYGLAMDVSFLLPPDANAFTLAGLGEFTGEVAGRRIRRTSSLTGDRLQIADEMVRVPTEIAVADFPQQRAAVARLAAGDPTLRTGATPVRHWTLDPAKARARIASLEPAYATIIALGPDDAWRYGMRARLLQMGPDAKRALLDYDRAIDLEESAETYSERSSLRREMGDLTGALADARSAFALEATAPYARSAADILSEMGKPDEALALLEDFDLTGDERVDLMIAKADILGEGGSADKGWALLTELEGERPGDARILNAQCWFMGNWSHRLDSAAETCDRAVKAGSYGAAMLDSRALVQYRLGKKQEALTDLQAALTASPDQTTSLFLRGLIALEGGKRADGERDIAAAIRLYGGIEQYFARFGVSRRP